MAAMTDGLMEVAPEEVVWEAGAKIRKLWSVKRTQIEEDREQRTLA